jgi:CHAT domain-containing protein
LDASNWTDASGWPERDEWETQRKKVQTERRRSCIELLRIEVSEKDPLPFELGRAYELYKALLGPFADAIEGKHLLVVPSGPLTTLPFSVLVTSKPEPADSMREAYQKASWLGLRQPITVLPGVSSLESLRRYAKAGSRPSKLFIGFGDPLVSGPDGTDKRAWAAQSCSYEAPRSVSQLGPSPDVRSVSRDGVFDLGILRRQLPLPETTQELCAIVHRLNVPESEIWLGGRMTEQSIAKLSDDGELAKYTFVHFATHGLVAGDLKGISEPALLLTPPPKDDGRENGLLTASKVARLVLNADWVVMSACNTAAGASEGAEALSGLVRAFFYAGARTLLVSHWRVYSQAAVKLTTGTFEALKSGGRDIGPAEGLRLAMQKIVQTGAVEPDNPSQSEAHPAFWAPFVVIGDAAAVNPPAK